MTALTNRLVAAVLSGSATPVDPGMVPTVLATACVEVLGVDGAGISLISDLRVPLAASNPAVRLAEQLQTTLGEGPCLAAVASGEPLCAGPVQIMRRWPVFHQELIRQTSFQSVASLPLALTGQRPFGALDLYATSPVPDLDLVTDPVGHDIVRVVSTFLTGAPLSDLLTHHPAPRPAQGAGDLVTARMDVWTAVGIVMARTGLGQPEALAVLRGHAFSRGTTLDDIAHQLTHHRLPVDDLVS